MEQNLESSTDEKQRHGCVTAWLILMIVVNSLTALANLFASDMITKNLPTKVSNQMVILLGIIGIGNIIFSVLLFKWKKVGFWGFIVSSIAAFTINLSIGLGIGQSILGLVGIGVLYAVLQIKKDNIPAWNNLE